YCGDLARRAGTVGIIPGSGFLPVYLRRWEALAEAGCDTLISAEISHFAARFAHARGLNLVDLGHSGLAAPGMAHLAYLLKCRLSAQGCETEFYDDTYAVNYYTSWAPSRQEENREASDPPGGIVLPFPR
ncbi:MAG: Nif3-like dinuclear metal center hexameric protein, partial [Bacteroidota bacterium]